MATTTECSAFSPDGRYYAFCGNDGKLKIWETASGRLKHEYTTNRHLSSPCNVIGWVSVSSQSANSTSPSPWKKRRRKSTSDETDRKIVAMGLTNGNIILYSIATASITMLENDCVTAVTALAWSMNSSLITAVDNYHIIEWNLEKNGIKCKWKSGKVKVTALAVLEDGKSLLSAERIIKWWDLTTKELIRTFTGHANQVTFLQPVKISDTISYLISSAHTDNYLSVWILDKDKNDKASIATLVIQDEATSISTLISEESQVVVLATTRSGQAQLFKYQRNGRIKPLKPSLNIAIASDVNQKETVQQIPILAGQVTTDEKLLLAYGSHLNLTFEKIVPDFTDKMQCLIRPEKLDTKRPKERKEDTVPRAKDAVIEDVEYLAPGMGVTTKRNRTSSSSSQLLLKDKLENLSLDADINTSDKIPTKKKTNMAQLLVQALNSKDRTILASVLFSKNETLICNTVAKLPVQTIIPLLKELAVMLQGRTYPSKIAMMWLRILITTHTAHILSRPDIMETLSPILNLIDTKLMLLTNVLRLKGKVSLITEQISHANEEHNKDITEENLIVYQDPDSSDEAPDMNDIDISSESDNWEEMSDQNAQDEQDEDDIKSVGSEDHNMDDDDSTCI